MSGLPVIRPQLNQDASFSSAFVRKNGWVDFGATDLLAMDQVEFEQPGLGGAESGCNPACFYKESVLRAIDADVGRIDIVSCISSNDFCLIRLVPDIDSSARHLCPRYMNDLAARYSERIVPTASGKSDSTDKVHRNALGVFVSGDEWPTLERATASGRQRDAEQPTGRGACSHQGRTSDSNTNRRTSLFRVGGRP